MLDKLLSMLRQYDMVRPGDRVFCAVSGGADSVALLYAMYLLKDKLAIDLAAVHYNHGLRREESDADEAFVRKLCRRLDIPLSVGSGSVKAGKKGLEAAAREARYAYFATLPGKLATAHTADDNAETVLLHLIRGTGLKGLGAIAPVRGSLIRPMLTVTRDEVLSFLADHNLTYVTDSSNQSDAFLRNRLRHHVMPLLKQENPRLSQNLSAMALRLREDEAALNGNWDLSGGLDIRQFSQLPPAMASRMAAAFLESCGVREPEAEHVRLVSALAVSDKPSASADLPGGVRVARCYDRLIKLEESPGLAPVKLACPGVTRLPELGLRVLCEQAQTTDSTADSFVVVPVGTLVLRSRQSGDRLRLPGGSKDLKKLFIDKKIPAHQRSGIPVLADDAGVLGVYSIGVNLDRAAHQKPAVRVTITKERSEEEK